jgi:hypothetical protein
METWLIWAFLAVMVALIVFGFVQTYVQNGGTLTPICEQAWDSTYTGWQTRGDKRIRCVEGSAVEVRPR